MSIFFYLGSGFLMGFIIAWILRTISVLKLQKSLKSMDGFLESERLMKERLQKENTQLHSIKEVSRFEYDLKLKELQSMNIRLDEDILLLQKDNEETRALLEAEEPIVHALKLKLIEAQNSVARYKSQLGIKS